MQILCRIPLHLVRFEVVDREIIGGATRPPEPWETGFKDTVLAYPGEITRVKAHFDLAGRYVWHCHLPLSVYKGNERGLANLLLV